jgi:hypothetical protein
MGGSKVRVRERELKVKVRFDVLTVQTIKITDFSAVTPCSLVNTQKRLGGIYCLHLQDKPWNYQNTRHHISENWNLELKVSSGRWKGKFSVKSCTKILRVQACCLPAVLTSVLRKEDAAASSCVLSLRQLQKSQFAIRPVPQLEFNFWNVMKQWL